MGAVLIHTSQLYASQLSPPPVPVCGWPQLCHGAYILSVHLFPNFHKTTAIETMGSHVILRKVRDSRCSGKFLSRCSAVVLLLDSAHSAHAVRYTAQSPFCLELESFSYLSFILYLESPFSLCDPKKRQALASSCTWMALSFVLSSHLLI